MAEEVKNEKSKEEKEEYLILDDEIQLSTHQRINKELCGHVVELAEGYAKVELLTTREMAVDQMGLVHGGFTFSAADFAAMAAVNDPNVVLVSSECRFLSPVKVGDTVTFEAKERYHESRKRRIHVVGKFKDVKVFEGDFLAVVLDRHVFKLKLIKDEKR
jgi:acyl-CoA thioesterase